MNVSEFNSEARLGVNDIRLRSLLALTACYDHDQKINTMFPPIEIGSITLVDQIVLLSLAKLLKPKKIVEIGTYLGYTSALLAMNIPDADIFTIDLPRDDVGGDFVVDDTMIFTCDKENDNYLRQKQMMDGQVYLDNLSTAELNRVKLIKADSTTLDFKSEFDRSQFVFIDGGHSKEIITKDTKNARSVVDQGVIIWHDYGSNIHREVTSFLHSEENRKFFHVIGSLCAFELIGF